MLDLLNKCLKKQTLDQVSKKINVSRSTVQRWIELKNVPRQYRFDLMNICGDKVNYSDYNETDKDQFFTPIPLAKSCWEKFKEITKTNVDDYFYIEPSAGDGSFMNVLPPGRTIGLDVEPRFEGVIKVDYLSWKPSDYSRKYVVFGNPPFGLRGHMALRFINHSLEFADYVCFILPQLFASDGKGSPMMRINGYKLLFSEPIRDNFHMPSGKTTVINGVFQIWTKYGDDIKNSVQKNMDDRFTVYSLSDGGTPSSTRNKHMLDKCTFYLPSTCFGEENMKMYKSFNELPNKKGYGVVCHKNFDFSAIDWKKVCFKSTNSALNLRISLISVALTGAINKM